MKEERVLYVFAALLVIILVGVMVPIIGDVNAVPERLWSAWEKVQQFFGSGYQWLKSVINTPAGETALLYTMAALVTVALLLVLITLWRRRRAELAAARIAEEPAAKPLKAAKPIKTTKAMETAKPVETDETDEAAETIEAVAAEPEVELEIEVEPEPVAAPIATPKPKPRTTEGRTFRVHVRKARKSVANFFTRVSNSIFNFISGIFHIIIDFAHVVIALLQVLVLMVIIAGVLILSKEWIQNNIEPAFTQQKLPADFHGLWGGLMFFAILLAVITAGILLLSLAFSVLARAFAKIIALGSLPEPKIIGRVMAYFVYSLAIITTLVIFSKLAAAIAALVLFVVAPVVGALLRLTLEEEEAQ